MCQNRPIGVYEKYIGDAVSAADSGLDEPPNLSGLARLFQEQRIDGLVCRSGVNVVYLSGIASPGTLGRHLDLTDTPRETFTVWPASGEPVVVVSEIAADVARMTSRIANVETYRDYLDAPEAVLASVIGKLNLAKSRVGFDQAWFGATRWAELSRLLPEMQPVDCTRQIDLVRAVKAPAEIEHLRHAAAVLDRALQDVFVSVRSGQTERQVNARVCARALELGAASVHGILQSSSNPILYGGESETILENGNMIRTDYVSYSQGYAANLSRLLHVGRPPRQTQAKYQSYLAMYKDAVRLLRPGAVGGEIHDRIQSMFKSNGWEVGPPISGHGIGAWFHQQRPLLVPGSTDVLEAGMVVAIEPISGHWHLQDEYLVTDSEPVRISAGFDIERLPWTE